MDRTVGLNELWPRSLARMGRENAAPSPQIEDRKRNGEANNVIDLLKGVQTMKRNGVLAHFSGFPDVLTASSAVH